MVKDVAPPSAHRLLVAEDDQALRDLMVQILRADGHEVTTVTNGLELVSVLEVSMDPEQGTDGFDLVISDIRMPGATGLHAFKLLGNEEGTPPVVFITAFGDEELHAEARRIGALTVLDKPIDFDELRALVNDFFAGGGRHC